MTTQTIPIQLIVGLGNPGAKYAKTRHNVGAWLVEKLAAQHNVALKEDKKFHGLYAKLTSYPSPCHIVVPTTFMNHSGRVVNAVAQYYKLPPEAILVAHDELDLPVGTVKLKLDGGHGGHNGLRDTFAQLHSKAFYRLRIGIGHPGHKNQVVNYVLSNAGKAEEQAIQQALDSVIEHLPLLINGDISKAMQLLHTK